MFAGASPAALYLWQAQALAMLRRALWKSDFWASAFLAKHNEEAASRRNSDLNAIAARRLKPDNYFKKYPMCGPAYMERLYGYAKALKEEKKKYAAYPLESGDTISSVITR